MQHLTEEEIALYAEALSSENFLGLPAHIKKHIAECDQCAAEAVDLYDIIKSDNSYGSKVKKTSKTLYLAGIAATALILITLTFILTNNQNFDTNSFKYAQKKSELQKHLPSKKVLIDTLLHTTPKPQKTSNQKLIAQAFKPNSNLEKLAERFKGNLRAQDTNIKTPHTLVITKNKKIILEWEIQPKTNLYIEIYNNEGEKIAEKQTSENKIEIEEKPSPGLYYWKLFTEDFDLLFCGRILIKELSP